MQSAVEGKPSFSDLEAMRQRVLGMAAEDVTGLWEVLWELNTEYPKIASAVRLFVAWYTMIHLIDDGLIVLVRWDSAEHTEEEVGLGEAVYLLIDDDNWRAPTESDCEQLRFHTTPEGDKVYFERPAMAS